MASNSRSSGTAALRYAFALVDLAQENGVLPKVESDMADLRAMLKSSREFRDFVRSPLYKADQQNGVLAALADKAGFSDLTRNFLFLLARNRRLSMLDAVVEAVDKTLLARRGEIRAKVQTATALGDTQRKNLEQTLGRTLGRPVTLETNINPDLIGGVVVTLGSLMIDDSVKSKIDRMGRAMKQRTAA